MNANSMENSLIRHGKSILRLVTGIGALTLFSISAFMVCAVAGLVVTGACLLLAGGWMSEEPDGVRG